MPICTQYSTISAKHCLASENAYFIWDIKFIDKVSPFTKLRLLKDRSLLSSIAKTFKNTYLLTFQHFQFVNGVLRSICREELDQSFNIGKVFESIASLYQEIERIGDDEDTKYSIIYSYLAALMLNKPLPTLRATESALVLSIMFE